MSLNVYNSDFRLPSGKNWRLSTLVRVFVLVQVDSFHDYLNSLKTFPPIETIKI